jgi:hypothetical protein
MELVQLHSALTSGLDLISQILSFLSCDSLQCRTTSSWHPYNGLSFPALDSWNNVLANMDILSGLGNANQLWVIYRLLDHQILHFKIVGNKL